MSPGRVPPSKATLTQSETTKRMLKREKNQLKKDSDKKNISESDKKEILVKTVTREKI